MENCRCAGRPFCVRRRRRAACAKKSRSAKSGWRRVVLSCVFAGTAAFGCCFVSRADALEDMLRKAKEQESRVTGENPEQIPDSRILVENRTQNDIRVASMGGQCIASGLEQVFYAAGKNYTPEGSVLLTLFGDAEYSGTVEEQFRQQGDMYTLVRFALRPAEEEREEDGDVRGEKSYWNLGDTVEREIGGRMRRFRCIDQDYRGNALFLCDSVIPADTGARYAYETLEDGSHGYVYHPGPIERFGDSGEYRDSRIRAWLAGQEENFPGAAAADTGVTRSYMGRSGSGTREQFDPEDFASYELGSQRMTDRLFILSLDEAMRYRRELWTIREEEASAFAGGYWLRSPMAGPGGGDSGYVYMVDLTDGSIHPQRTESPEGVRPAFVMPQRN